MEYYLDPTSQYPILEPTRHAGKNPVMQVLEHVFDPSSTRVPTFKDCILVSLDLEYTPFPKSIQQIGLATLDTRDICNLKDDDSAASIISAQLVLLEKHSHKKGVYLYGPPKKRYGANIESLLLPQFTIPDEKNTTKFRNIILVGHGIETDIWMIKCCSGLDLLNLPTIKAIVDTSPLLNRIFAVPSLDNSLRRTCQYLGMYRRNMHNAGNDAMYTLKALLLLFHHYKSEKISQNYDGTEEIMDRKLLYESQLESIKKIGRCNNGVDRHAKKRRRKPRGEGTLPGQRSNLIRESDQLDLEDGGDGGIMDSLFSSDHHDSE